MKLGIRNREALIRGHARPSMLVAIKAIADAHGIRYDGEMTFLEFCVLVQESSR